MKQLIQSNKLPLFLGLILFSVVSIIISSNKSLWRDESFTVLASRLQPAQILQVAQSDFSPPLFYFLIHYWMQLIEPTDITLRILPLIFSLGTIIILSKIIHKFIQLKWLSNSRLYYIFVLFQPTLIYFSTELRNYSLMMLLLSLMLWSLLHISSNRLLSISLISISSITLLYTHTLALIIVFSFFGAGILAGIIVKQFKHSKDLAIASILTTIGYMPWINQLRSQLETVQEGFWISFHPLHSIFEYRGLWLVNEGVVSYPWAFNLIQYIGLFLTILGSIFIGHSIFSKTGKLPTVSHSDPDINSREPARNATHRLAGGESSPDTQSRRKNIIAYARSFVLSFTQDQDDSSTKKESNQSFFTLTTLLTLIFVVLGFYLISFFKSPILYHRYLAGIFPVTLLLMIFGLNHLRLFNISILKLLITTLLVLSGIVAADMLQGISQTDYKELKNITEIPVYTQEPLDISPCVYYHSKCSYVGDITQVSTFIGPSQLPNIPSVASWKNLPSGDFATTHRGDFSNQHEFPDENFVVTHQSNLGDGVVLTLWSRN